MFRRLVTALVSVALMLGLAGVPAQASTPTVTIQQQATATAAPVASAPAASKVPKAPKSCKSTKKYFRELLLAGVWLLDESKPDYSVEVWVCATQSNTDFNKISFGTMMWRPSNKMSASVIKSMKGQLIFSDNQGAFSFYGPKKLKSKKWYPIGLKVPSCKPSRECLLEYYFDAHTKWSSKPVLLDDMLHVAPNAATSIAA